MSNIQKDLIETFAQVMIQFTTEIENFSYSNHKLGSDVFILYHLGYKLKCNMKEIIEILSYPPSTATRKVNKLVDLGYIKRFRPQNNRRSVELKLTNKGREVFAQFHKKRFDPLLKIFKEFPEPHIVSFYEILQKIL